MEITILTPNQLMSLRVLNFHKSEIVIVQRKQILSESSFIQHQNYLFQSLKIDFKRSKAILENADKGVLKI